MLATILRLPYTSLRGAYLSTYTFLSLSVTRSVNLLTPNDDYSGRTAPLTSKCCILYIYSTNTGTEYLRFFLLKMQLVS